MASAPSHPGLDHNTKGSRVRTGRSAIQDLKDARIEIENPAREYDILSHLLYDLLAIALAAEPVIGENAEEKKPRDFEADGKTLIYRTDIEQFIFERKQISEIEENDGALDGMPAEPISIDLHDSQGPGQKKYISTKENQKFLGVADDAVGLAILRDKEAEVERRSFRSAIAARRKAIRKVQSFLEKWKIWTSDMPVRDDAPPYTDPEAAAGTRGYDAVMRDRLGGSDRSRGDDDDGGR
jgi:hypothetical protein